MAFTLTKEVRSIMGDKRVVMAEGTVNIVGDTYDTKLRELATVQVNAGGANAVGCTYTDGTITFTGNVGAVSILAIGT